MRVGRQWRFRKRDIDARLESQRPRNIRPAPAAPRPPAAAATRPRVLVVDDEASIRDLLSKTLALAEYDVLSEQLRGRGVRAVLTAPIVGGAGVIGNLNAVRADVYEWPGETIAIAEHLAYLIGSLLDVSAQTPAPAVPSPGTP